MATYTNIQQLLSIQQVEQDAISDLAYELGIAVTFGDTILPIAPFLAIGFAIYDLIEAFSGGRPKDQDTNNVIGAYNMSAYWPLHSLASNLSIALKNGAPISDSRPEIQAEFSAWKQGTIESIQGVAGVETGSSGPGYWQLQQLIDASWAWSQDGEAKVLDVVKAIDQFTIQLSQMAKQTATQPSPTPTGPGPQQPPPAAPVTPTPITPVTPPATSQPTPTPPPTQPPITPVEPPQTTQPTPQPPPAQPPPTTPAQPSTPSWPWGTIPAPCIPAASGDNDELSQLSICLNENLSTLAYIAWLIYQALGTEPEVAPPASPPASDGGSAASQCCTNIVNAINAIPIAIASAIAKSAPGAPPAPTPVDLTPIVAALTALNETVAELEACVCPPLKQIADSVVEADALAKAAVKYWDSLGLGDPNVNQLVLGTPSPNG